MAEGNPDATWQRACTRGAVAGLVLAAHIAIVGAILLPAKPRSPGTRVPQRTARDVLQVVFLSPQPMPAAPTPRPRRLAAHQRLAPRKRRAQVQHTPIASANTPTRVTLAPAPAATAPVPDYIAGGGFATRLSAAQAPRRALKLPGGHHYLASDLQFVPLAQQSLQAKVNKYAGFLFGSFDPVCKNTQHELAKTRKQMLADGYTLAQLQRRLREHHCQ